MQNQHSAGAESILWHTLDSQANPTQTVTPNEKIQILTTVTILVHLSYQINHFEVVDMMY
jgi:hypothetical protein